MMTGPPAGIVRGQKVQTTMKKYGGMMYPNRRRKAIAKRITCAKCGKELTPSTAYSYVDGCNCAITNSAPEYCLNCYKQVYKWIEYF